MNAKLVISIVNWNSGKELYNCLKRLNRDPARTMTYEIIVIDNFSNKDDLKPIEEVFPAVKIIKNDCNVGYASGHNIIIRKTDSDFVLLLNPDCLVDLQLIEKMIKIMSMGDKIGIASPKVLNPNGDIAKTVYKLPTLKNEFLKVVTTYLPPFSGKISDMLLTKTLYFNSRDVIRIRKTEAIGGPFLLINRKLLNEIGLLDENLFLFSEESDLCLRAHNLGWKLLYIPELSLEHMLGKSRNKAPGGLSIYHQYRSRLYFFKKHYGTSIMFALSAIYISFSLYCLLFYYTKYLLNFLKIKSELGKTNMNEVQTIMRAAIDFLKGDIASFGINEKFLLTANKKV